MHAVRLLDVKDKEGTGVTRYVLVAGLEEAIKLGLPRYLDDQSDEEYVFTGKELLGRKWLLTTWAQHINRLDFATGALLEQVRYHTGVRPRMVNRPAFLRLNHGKFPSVLYGNNTLTFLGFGSKDEQRSVMLWIDHGVHKLKLVQLLREEWIDGKLVEGMDASLLFLTRVRRASGEDRVGVTLPQSLDDQPAINQLMRTMGDHLYPRVACEPVLV